MPEELSVRPRRPESDTIGQPDGSWTRAAAGIDRAADRLLLIHASYGGPLVKWAWRIALA
jgi:hypothetical protein